MQLLIKQRVFSWSDTYDIYDEQGQPKYFVKAEIFTFGHQIHVYDRDNNEIGAIYQKLFRFLPEFEVEIFGKIVGRIKKEFSFLKPKYDIDYNGWHVEGDFFGWDYDVYAGEQAILHISKQLFRWGDTYVLDFARPEDELLGLLLVIAIDAANCSNGD